MIKLSITFAVTFVFSVGKRSCQVMWNQTMDVIWCDVMWCDAILCHVKFVMIWYQFHVTLRHFMSYYIISDYASSHQVVCYQYGMLYWTYLFFLQVLELLQRCITTSLCKRPSSMQHLKNTMCWFCQPSQRRHQFSRRKSPLRCKVRSLSFHHINIKNDLLITF